MKTADRVPTRDIDFEACEWALRLAEGRLDASAREEFSAWLAQDARHRGALLRAQAGLCLLDEVRGESGTGATVPVLPASATAQRPRRWQALTAGAIAASIAGLLMAAALLSPEGQYGTSVGELRQISLEDGSLAVINTDSSVEVDLEPEYRAIELARGEAWFQVAKDRRRPFIVSVDRVHVQATGTAFSVRRLKDAVQVIVTEGSVEAWNEDRPGDRVAIAANHEATVPLTRHAVPETRPAREEALAWRQGEIVLNGMTVAEAAEEFNRYNRRKIIVRDPSARNLRIVSYFKTNQPELFAKTVASEIGIVVQEVDGNIVI